MYIDTSSRLRFYVDTSDDGGSWVSSMYTLPANNTWYHAVGTYNGSELRLYVDSDSKDNDSQSETMDSGGSSNMRIGIDTFDNQEFVVGRSPFGRNGNRKIF